MNHRRQRGMTLLGVLSILGVLGIFVLAAVRLAPAFLEYQTVAKALDSVKSSGETQPAQISRSIEKTLDLGDVKSIEAKDVEISREDDQLIVHAVYDYKAPFLANISFLVHFDKQVEIPAQ
jgi:type II secretory pathway pseudopilin PulG